MGIGYVDSVVVYNRYINGLMGTETYFGTRFAPCVSSIRTLSNRVPKYVSVSISPFM